MLHIHHSNRLECLLVELTKVTATPLTTPFINEVIVVQNLGMARWVAQQLAERNGICAGYEFPLPASFFWRALQAWFTVLPDQAAFSQNGLLWRIARLLPGYLADPAFSELKQYLVEDQTSELRLFQLAQRIADIFDQYLVFRPDMVIEWEQVESSTTAHWQARLWRVLAKDSGFPHRGRILTDLAQAVATGKRPKIQLPERISLFGLTALAPAYVQVLDAVARYSHVHVFLLNPCREYWADLVDEIGQARRRARARQAYQPDPTVLLDVGQPLLAALGHAGQIFLDQLLELGGSDYDAFEQPAQTRLLGQIQADILELRDRRGPPDMRTLLDLADDSLQIHCVHSPLREIQVLHDHLLRLMETHPQLKPRDILVIAPNIDLYAPYIDAVFGTATPKQRLPWSIAGRQLKAEHPLSIAIETLLRLPHSRFDASEILSLLQVPAIARQLGLTATAVAHIHTWVRESGIRWGADGAMRADLGLPHDDANTWLFGLRRLFLGMALPAVAVPKPYANVLPYGDLEGNECAALGLLQTFIDRLLDWRQRLQPKREVSAWRNTLHDLWAEFLKPTMETEVEFIQTLDKRLDDLVAQAAVANFNQFIPLAVIRDLLERAMEDQAGPKHFLNGKITFCGMVPMRSIPFRVLCLIGLDGNAFPRRQRPIPFDLMTQAPRRGDRSRRRDDRYLFLEALISAREVLYLSYVGRDIRDNSPKNPTIVVSELLDYLVRSYRLEHDNEVLQHLVLEHPLQPFSPRYFDASHPRLFSYAASWLDAARANVTASPLFTKTPLPPMEGNWRTLELDDLIRFLRQPVHYFLTRRLGLYLPEAIAPVADIEPFALNHLEQYTLKQQLLTHLQTASNPALLLAQLRGSGQLPHGVPGELVIEELTTAAQTFLESLHRLRTDTLLEPINLDLNLGAFRLLGRLSERRSNGLLRYRFAKLKAKDRISAWVWHLALNALDPPPTDMARNSFYLAEDKRLTFKPLAPDQAQAHLLTLLKMYELGLTIPTAFFPETSLIAWEKSGRAARETLNKAWEDHNGYPGEGSAFAVRLAFQNVDPLASDEFIRWANAVYAPLHQNSH